MSSAAAAGCELTEEERQRQEAISELISSESSYLTSMSLVAEVSHCTQPAAEQGTGWPRSVVLVTGAGHWSVGSQDSVTLGLCHSDRRGGPGHLTHSYESAESNRSVTAVRWASYSWAYEGSPITV